MPETTAPPRFAVMHSTEVPALTVHQDGRTTPGTARIVHAPGDPVPDRVQPECGPNCGCKAGGRSCC